MSHPVQSHLYMAIALESFSCTKGCVRSTTVAGFFRSAGSSKRWNFVLQSRPKYQSLELQISTEKVYTDPKKTIPKTVSEAVWSCRELQVLKNNPIKLVYVESHWNNQLKPFVIASNGHKYWITCRNFDLLWGKIIAMIHLKRMSLIFFDQQIV